MDTQSANTSTLQQGNINLHQIQQPLYPNETSDLQQNNEFIVQQRKKLILTINQLLLYQQIIQVGIIILCFYMPKLMTNYFLFFYKGDWLIYEDSNFYNFNPEAVRVSTILFVVIILIFLLFVRFFKKIKNFKYQKIIYIIYFVFYTLASHSINFGLDYFYFLTYKDDTFLNDKLYRLCWFYSGVPFAVLFMLIQFHFQLKKINANRLLLKCIELRQLDYIFPYVYLPIMIIWIFKIYIFYDGWYEVEKHIPPVYINLFTPLWPFLFTIFYIPSLFQIYQGKFKLSASDSYLGSVLAISNMFLLCFKD